MAKLQLDIVTAERLVTSEEVDVLVAPGVDGELAILPHHAPLLTVLKPGEIRVLNDGEESDIVVSGGFMEVMPDKVTILADTAERADEIDEGPGRGCAEEGAGAHRVRSGRHGPGAGRGVAAKVPGSPQGRPAQA